MVPAEILPNYLGGNVKLDHKNWLKECNRLITNKTSTCFYYYLTHKKANNNNNGFCETIKTSSSSSLSTATTGSSNTSSSSKNRKRPSSDFIDTVENHQKIFLSNNINGLVNENVKEKSEILLNGKFINSDEIDFHIDEYANVKVIFFSKI